MFLNASPDHLSLHVLYASFLECFQLFSRTYSILMFCDVLNIYCCIWFQGDLRRMWSEPFIIHPPQKHLEVWQDMSTVHVLCHSSLADETAAASVMSVVFKWSEWMSRSAMSCIFVFCYWKCVQWWTSWRYTFPFQLVRTAFVC